MTRLRFHRELYSGRALDASVKLFREVASFELLEEEEYWVVEVKPHASDDAREIIGELGNYALGLTIRERLMGPAW